MKEISLVAWGKFRNLKYKVELVTVMPIEMCVCIILEMVYTWYIYDRMRKYEQCEMCYVNIHGIVNE
jgi:hypothetical protein